MPATLPPPEPTAAELLVQFARHTIGTAMFVVAILLLRASYAAARTAEKIGGG